MENARLGPVTIVEEPSLVESIDMTPSKPVKVKAPVSIVEEPLLLESIDVTPSQPAKVKAPRSIKVPSLVV